MARALSDLITHEKRWHARNPVNVFIRSPSRAASNAHINLCVPGPIASIGYCWLRVDWLAPGRQNGPNTPTLIY